jgi:hypothetical protein
MVCIFLYLGCEIKKFFALSHNFDTRKYVEGGKQFLHTDSRLLSICFTALISMDLWLYDMDATKHLSDFRAVPRKYTLSNIGFAMVERWNLMEPHKTTKQSRKAIHSISQSEESVNNVLFQAISCKTSHDFFFCAAN